MRLEQRLRDGQEDGSVIERQVGTFERHTKVSEHCAHPMDPSLFLLPSPFRLLPAGARFLESYPFTLQGIGRKVMERQGWAEGQGLGSRCSGVPEALDGDGQHPRCKRGLG